jgi:hypothetical protein
MRQAGYTVHMKEMRCVYKTVLGNSERKRSVWRPSINGRKKFN